MRQVTKWLLPLGKYYLRQKSYPKNVKTNADFLEEQKRRFEAQGIKCEIRCYRGQDKQMKNARAIFVKEAVGKNDCNIF